MAGESLADILGVAVELAERAGEHTLRYFQGRFEVETKPDTSFVTQVDRESEQLMREALASRFPEDGVLGEELGETNPGARRRWILDPIDGTFSFVHGVPLYGVLIGVEEEGEAVAGVIHLPALPETLAAARGEGCTWQGNPARVSTTDELDRALLNTTEMHFAGERAEGLARVLAASGPARTWADCYAYALVATGRADVAIDPLMNIWDCAALLPIVEEAGGRFTDWTGARTIDGGCAVATNGILHDRVLALLRG